MNKTILIIATIILTMSFGTLTAQNSCCSKNHNGHVSMENHDNSNMKHVKGENNINISVLGNCEMCETRIENVAKSINGVITAEWDKSSETLNISFDGNIDVNKVERAIAGVGHDTENYKADTKVYNSLPGCCKYNR